MHKSITKTIMGLGLIIMISSNAHASSIANKAYLSGDYKKAFQIYLQEADKQDATTRYRLGWMYRNGKGVVQDDTQAVHYYTLAADNGNVDAQFYLGGMYGNEGDTKDDVKALHYLTLASNQGDQMAQFYLGSMYEHGNGVAQDDVKSIHYHTLAADHGLGASQYHLGEIYKEGKKVAQDYRKAVHYYTLAAEQGNGNAQLMLGVMYDEGLGIIQDGAKAVHYYTLAGEQAGSAEAINNLGTMYGKGNGVSKNLIIAHALFNLSSADSNQEATENRNLIAKNLSSKQINEAQALARNPEKLWALIAQTQKKKK